MIRTFCSIQIYKNQDENLTAEIILKIKLICLIIKTNCVWRVESQESILIDMIQGGAPTPPPPPTPHHFLEQKSICPVKSENIKSFHGVNIFVYTHMCLKIQLCLKIWFSNYFFITWYAEAAIYAKNPFHSFCSFSVKFSEWPREVIEWNWQSVTKLNEVKNTIMQVTYYLNGPISNLLFYCHIISHWEKVTSYGEFNHNRTLEVQIVSKISEF